VGPRKPSATIGELTELKAMDRPYTGTSLTGIGLGNTQARCLGRAGEERGFSANPGTVGGKGKKRKSSEGRGITALAGRERALSVACVWYNSYK